MDSVGGSVTQMQLPQISCDLLQCELVGAGGSWWALVGAGGRWWELEGAGGRCLGCVGSLLACLESISATRESSRAQQCPTEATRIK